MDSISQIALGAAVGEVTGGKKFGNRAMVWGAIAGTIPDLDVFANFCMSEMNAVAAHRGFSHSLLFPILFAPILAWLIHQYYDKGYHDSSIVRYSKAAFFGFPMIVLAFYTLPFIGFLFILGTILMLMARFVSSISPTKGFESSHKAWTILIFWSIFTHPLLDCFTTYGTQLFLPFSNYRVAFNVISVADPIYTVPFLICIIVAAILSRSHKLRSIINWAGIIWSCSYLLFCYYHKTKVNSAFERSLEKTEKKYSRYMTSPTIFNNILWSCIAETEESYLVGLCNLRNEGKVKITEVPKGREMLTPIQDTDYYKMLKWFTNGYYTVIKDENGRPVIHDIRFGVITEGPQLGQTPSPIRFVIHEDTNPPEIRKYTADRDMKKLKELFQQLSDEIMNTD